MWPDRVSNPGPLTYESGALATALRGPAQGHVTLERLIRPGPYSNWSEILRLSRIPASLKKFYRPDNIFSIISLWEIICRSKASNSAENNPTWPKFELVRDFMPL